MNMYSFLLCDSQITFFESRLVLRGAEKSVVSFFASIDFVHEPTKLLSAIILCCIFNQHVIVVSKTLISSQKSNTNKQSHSSAFRYIQHCGVFLPEILKMIPIHKPSIYTNINTILMKKKKGQKKIILIGHWWLSSWRHVTNCQTGRYFIRYRILLQKIKQGHIIEKKNHASFQMIWENLPCPDVTILTNYNNYNYNYGSVISQYTISKVLMMFTYQWLAESSWLFFSNTCLHSEVALNRYVSGNHCRQHMYPFSHSFQDE